MWCIFDLHGGLMSYEQFQACVQQDDRASGSYTFRREFGLPELKPYAGVKAFLFFEGEAAGGGGSGGGGGDGGAVAGAGDSGVHFECVSVGEAGEGCGSGCW